MGQPANTHRLIGSHKQAFAVEFGVESLRPTKGSVGDRDVLDAFFGVTVKFGSAVTAIDDQQGFQGLRLFVAVGSGRKVIHLIPYIETVAISIDSHLHSSGF